MGPNEAVRQNKKIINSIPKSEKEALEIHKGNGSVTKILLWPVFSNLVLVTSVGRIQMRKIIV